MVKQTRRGYCETDKRDFSSKCLKSMQQAQKDIVYLINNGYDLERVVIFVGNRFQFSARQRMALTRATSSQESVERRRQKQLNSFAGKTVLIDGFNLAIVLEAALSPETTLLHCMDNCVRDLCGLHGTYRIISSTGAVIEWIAETLQTGRAEKAVFYLDAPVSNSGRLKARILEVFAQHSMPVEVHLVPNADMELFGKECVVSSDAIILERCSSWVNLGADIIKSKLPQRQLVDLSMKE